MIRPEMPPQRNLAEISTFLGISALAANPIITGVTSDSRQVIAGDLFVALQGESAHGAGFAATALENGAVAVLTDAIGSEMLLDAKFAAPVLICDSLRSRLGELAAWFFGVPSRDGYVACITGTNGKTTTTYLLDQIWRHANLTSGLIGTVGIRIGETEYPATHTTPESDEIARILARAIEVDVRRIAMEVSSHALVQNRIMGTHFKSVGFTNLSQDHLDYHGDMESYFQAKRSLFRADFAERAFVNVDNEYGRRLSSEIDIETIRLSLTGPADWYFDRTTAISGGFEISIRGTGGILIEATCNLIGKHNLENLLLAVAIASDSGVDPLVIADSIPSLTGAPGRLERVAPDAPFLALVDYAHTPDAVTRVLTAVRELGANRVIAILGCGGDRDKSKRAPMGEALHAGSDLPIFTSDNPRSEDPAEILREMVGDLSLKPTALVIPDRRSAIKRAVELAAPGDLILVLGKGHESGQEIAGKKFAFSDRDELRAAIGALR